METLLDSKDAPPVPRRAVSGSSPRPAAKRYERIGQLMIRPLVLRGEHSAFDLARLFYSRYSNLDFLADLQDYFRNGYVISQPHLFGLFKPIEHEGKRGWFVRIAIGNIGDLIRYFPCPLPFIAFCRNNDATKMVIVDFDWFLKKVGQLNGYSNGSNGKEKVN
jgi:hypothetical protein